MIRFDHVYIEIFNNSMEDAQRKVNSHHVLEFDRCDTWFIVQEAINPREVQPTKNFIVRLDQRWCDCGKFQKGTHVCLHVIASCKHAHHEYRTYIDPCIHLKVSQMCTEDCLTNYSMKCISHNITNHQSSSTKKC